MHNFHLVATLVLPNVRSRLGELGELAAPPLLPVSPVGSFFQRSQQSDDVIGAVVALHR